MSFPSTDFTSADDFIFTSSSIPDPPSEPEDFPSNSSENTDLVKLFYEPHMDDWTREVAQLNSLKFFVSGSPGNIFNFWELFPNLTEEILLLSITSSSLRHSMLATAAVIRDAVMHRPPSEFYYLEKQTSLRLLQADISGGAVDEALALSVLMQICMDTACGNLRSTYRHMRGLWLIYEQLRKQGGGKKLTPLGMLLKRMALRTDLAITSMMEETPCFEPATMEDEMEDRKWMVEMRGVARYVLPANIEWALASFEMDNLAHRAYIFGKKADEARARGAGEETIKLEYRILMQGFEMWKQRSIIRQQEELERYARLTTPLKEDPQSRFLWYQPLPLQNTYYAKLLNQWRAMSIFASLVINPRPGPEPHSSNRFQNAVEICRTHVALGQEGYIGPSWQCLFYAGVAFGGTNLYPMESGWVLDTLKRIVSVLPFLEPIVARMPRVWNAEYVHWNSFAQLWEVREQIEALE